MSAYIVSLAIEAGAREKTEEWAATYTKVYAKSTEYLFTEAQLEVFAELVLADYLSGEMVKEKPP